MSHSLQNILVVSDLDGTLIGRGFQIPARNFAALDRFRQAGGRFAIATGRSMESGRRYAQESRPNAPCVVLNGAVLYDYETEKIIWDHPLPDTSADYLGRILERFPNVGMEVFADHIIHIVRYNSVVRDHIEHESLTVSEGPLAGVPGRWYKALMALEPGQMAEMQSFVDSFPHADVRFVASSPTYFEMLPAGVDKGTALAELLRILGIRREDSYAVGDYYNDLELLAAAGTGAVPANAPDDLKKQAALTLCHCDDGVVADLIEHIEAGRE